MTCAVAVELLHVDGRTDRPDEATSHVSRFLQFCVCA